jgi:hypothetical protein
MLRRDPVDYLDIAVRDVPDEGRDCVELVADHIPVGSKRNGWDGT